MKPGTANVVTLAHLGEIAEAFGAEVALMVAEYAAQHPTCTFTDALRHAGVLP